MQIIGYQNMEFKGDKGEEVKGMQVFLGEDITKDGDGMRVTKIWLTPKKLEELSVQIALGVEVDVVYNRYGKVADLRYS